MDTYCKVGGATNESYYVQTLTTTDANTNVDYLAYGAPDGGYDYYSNTRIIVNEGAGFTINLTPSAASNCARIKAWIDWNGDSDFNDFGEEIYTAGNSKTCQNHKNNKGRNTNI